MTLLDSIFAEIGERHQLDRIEALLKHLITIGEKIMADLTALQAAVANETTVEQSVITLLTQLAAQVAALPLEQPAIDALAAQITANAVTMSNAVTANTPAAPAA
jgi:hypothetical protein